MTGALRSRIALLAGAAAFFLPVLWSSLGGLSNVVTCSEKSPSPFAITTAPGTKPVLTTGLSESRAPGQASLCGELSLTLSAAAGRNGAVEVRIALTNHSAHTWRGSVELAAGSVTIPVPFGEIGPGETRSATEALHLPDGTHTVGGSLYLGP